MGELSYQAKAWLRHHLTATSRYHLHSPFLHQLYEQVLLPARRNKDPDPVKQYRALLYQDQRLIRKKELGAKKPNPEPLRVKAMASQISMPPKYGRLLAYLIPFLNCRHVLELGTGLGIGTAYLAYSMTNDEKGLLSTIEGCPETHATTKRHWQVNLQDLKMPSFYLAEIEQILPVYLNDHPAPDLVLIDANHQKEALQWYLKTLLPALANRGVVVIDDIHWSRSMAVAWDHIKADERIQMSIDFYRMGIAFKNQRLSPVHPRIRL